MKAVVKTETGFDHMQYTDIPEPKATGDLVKIKIAYPVSAALIFMRSRAPYASTAAGCTRP